MCTECLNDLDYFTQENFNDDDTLFVVETKVPNVCHCFLLSSLYHWVFGSEIPLENPDYKNTRKNPIDNTSFDIDTLKKLHNMFTEYYHNKNIFRDKTYRKLKKLNFPSDFAQEDIKEFYQGVSKLKENEDISLTEALDTFINFKRNKKKVKKSQIKIVSNPDVKEFMEGVKALQKMGMNFIDAVNAYVQDIEEMHGSDDEETLKTKKISQYVLESYTEN